jgi:wyosine [tRNA(Phe)-imidazoG37] synthetase (radical SAM superfamily)
MEQKLEQRLAFGPVPSRRLGRSLGINNIPPKVCSYACVYCQLGRTLKMQVRRQTFYEPEKILQTVQQKVNSVQAAGESIDYLTFVPDGEPTLDLNLGHEIELLRPLGFPIAIITNAALIWHEEVRTALRQADWVSLKMDAPRQEVWRRLNRPYGALQLSTILAGAREFAVTFDGKLVTETMLVEGINDSPALLMEMANLVAQLQPDTAYLSIPIRPPAESWVRPPGEAVINQAYQLFSDRLKQVECLIGYEGNAFAFSGNVEDDLLSITAVHPMREEALSEFLARAGAGWPVVDRLVAHNQLVQVSYQGRKFYLRKLRRSTTAKGNDCGRAAAKKVEF